MDKFSDFVLNGVANFVEVLIHFFKRGEGMFEFHLRKFEEFFFEVSVDHSPGNFLFGHLRFEDDSLGIFKEANYAFHHSNCFVKWAVIVIV